MKFGVREIANVVFRAKNEQTIGNRTFAKGQPVFYLDTAKTSSMEGAATTVYATGGRGNTRLIAWEGEKTLTFTVEDALLSPISFAMLSGAGVIKGAANSNKLVHFHQTTNAVIDTSGDAAEIDLTDALESTESICPTAPIYIMKLDDYGDLTGEIITGWSVKSSGDNSGKALTHTKGTGITGPVMVDYYVLKKEGTVSELQIDAEHFGGYYYVEADTLFRRQSDGKDLPANLTFPNVKIQSNFTFAMASSGDPSTFSFTMDAFPGYTYFDQTRKVLCVIQVIEDAEGKEENIHSVMGHKDGEEIDTAFNDSTAEKLTVTVTTQPVIETPKTLVEGTATTQLSTEPVCSPDVVTFTLSGNTATSTGEHTATVTYSVNATKLAAYNATYDRSYTAADVVLPTAASLTWTVSE